MFMSKYSEKNGYSFRTYFLGNGSFINMKYSFLGPV